MAPIPLPWAGPFFDLKDCRGGFLNVNDSMIHDPMTSMWAGTHTRVPESACEAALWEEQVWEGQGRGWLFSQLKRGSYHFLPRQGSTSPGPAFLCGFSCPESVMDLGEWGASVWERSPQTDSVEWGWRMGVEDEGGGWEWKVENPTKD